MFPYCSKKRAFNAYTSSTILTVDGIASGGNPGDTRLFSSPIPPIVPSVPAVSMTNFFKKDDIVYAGENAGLQNIQFTSGWILGVAVVGYDLISLSPDKHIDGIVSIVSHSALQDRAGRASSSFLVQFSTLCSK